MSTHPVVYGVDIYIYILYIYYKYNITIYILYINIIYIIYIYMGWPHESIHESGINQENNQICRSRKGNIYKVKG